MESEEDTYNIIFLALKHPIRRRILRQLEKQPTTFTGLLNGLGIDNGLLNYHLNNLDTLISKGSDEEYRLSDFGVAALSLTRKVEDPNRTRENKIHVFDKEIPIIHVFAIVLTILIISNVYFFYSLQSLSSDNTNALSWTLLQARGNYRECINVLNNSLINNSIETGDLNVIQRDMREASKYLMVASNLDKKHQEQWNVLRQASDSISDGSKLVSSKIATNNETNLSASQEFYLNKLVNDLTRMEKAFPQEFVLGSSPRIVFDDKHMTEAVEVAIELDTNLNGVFDAFCVGKPFTIVFGEDYIWIEE